VLKTKKKKYTIAFFLVIFLFFLGRMNTGRIPEWWQGFLSLSLDFSAYSLRFFNEPYKKITRVIDQVSLWIHTKQELKNQVSQMQGKIEEYERFYVHFLNQEKELKYLRRIVRILPEIPLTLCTVRVVAMSVHSLYENLFVALPKEPILHKNQVVYNPEGLIGRIMELGKRHARVMLITNAQSKVPVQGFNQDWHGILLGQGHNIMRIDVNATCKGPNINKIIKVDDVVVTSGIGGIFPKGLSAAKITSVKENVILAKPLIRAHKVDYALVIDPSS
jgi:rod shape-determining protein MreC